MRISALAYAKAKALISYAITVQLINAFVLLIQVTQYTTADRCRFAVGPQRTGERNCRGLRTILRELVKKNLDCTVY